MADRGLGVRYLEPEFRALGIPMAERGAGRRLPRGNASHLDSGVRGARRAVRLVLGCPGGAENWAGAGRLRGESVTAYRRSVTSADGWYGFALDLDETRTALVGLRAAADRLERTAGLGRLEISVTPRGIPDLDEARRYAELGVDQLILRPSDDPRGAGALALIERIGNDLIGRV